ncbi:NAD-dependent epimerase/dehydratase family protein [Siphonobacter aquaeclarae]|uniref:NAD dependent epimerase/dehydratase family protein n=1 Tax=Siphonobacter aquaeclarae TaxID=563176 RepID=A0A1G9HJL2_9BACT|nr:NAD-dependent epimerase/dehydratase family protein [Siphonobacter aquaeclarae]SDL13137.1 NAD dependent epimerase/dehydratase family protein [Siphonobacter aquaeclarae]
MKPVLVTGASGLLAVHTILQLLESDYPVRALVRDPDRLAWLTRPGLEIVPGSVEDRWAVARAVRGCGAVVHAAAITDPDRLGYAEYKAVNVDATRCLLKEAVAAGVRKFVYVSTANTLGYGSRERPGDETMPANGPFRRSAYARSKGEGEDWVRRFSDDLEVVVVHPTFLIGAYDAKPSSGRIITLHFDRRWIFCPPGGKNFVDVRDAAKGVVAALVRGKSGESYLLAGENRSYREFFGQMSQYMPRRPKLITLPAAVLLAAGLVGSILRRCGIRTALSLTNTRILCVSNYYSGAKATRELGVPFQPVSGAIAEAVNWFRQTGRIGR